MGAMRAEVGQTEMGVRGLCGVGAGWMLSGEGQLVGGGIGARVRRMCGLCGVGAGRVRDGCGASVLGGAGARRDRGRCEKGGRCWAGWGGSGRVLGQCGVGAGQGRSRVGPGRAVVWHVRATSGPSPVLSQVRAFVVVVFASCALVVVF